MDLRPAALFMLFCYKMNRRNSENGKLKRYFAVRFLLQSAVCCDNINKLIEGGEYPPELFVRVNRRNLSC